MPSFQNGGRRVGFARGNGAPRYPRWPSPTSRASVYAAGIAETVALAESVAAVMSAVVSPAETVTLSEALAAVAAFVVGPAETVTLAEQIAASAAFAVAAAETVTVGEALSAVAAFVASPAETVTLSEQLAAGLLLTATLAETVALSESVAATYAAVVAPGETVALSESASVSAAFATGLAESLSLSELTSAALAAVIGLSESVTVGESVAAGMTATIGLSESLAVGESAGVLMSAIASFAESMSVGELVAALVVPATPPTGEQRAREALFSYFAANWTGAPMTFENESFNPPLGSWIRVSMIHTTRQQVTQIEAGSRRFECKGYVIVQVFTAYDTGQASMAALVDRIIAVIGGVRIAQPNTTEPIVVRAATTRDLGQDLDAWNMAVVTAPFVYWDIR